MRMREARTSPALVPMMMCAAVGGTASCATTHNYVNKSIPNDVDLADSPAHGFRYVTIREEIDGLVVYGQVTHQHLQCEPEGHVDLAVVSAQGEPEFSTAIAMSRRQSRKGGWHRAAFRGKLAYAVPPDSTVRLRFHDEHCIITETFECPENRAVAAADDS